MTEVLLRARSSVLHEGVLTPVHLLCDYCEGVVVRNRAVREIQLVIVEGEVVERELRIVAVLVRERRL